MSIYAKKIRQSPIWDGRRGSLVSIEPLTEATDIFGIISRFYISCMLRCIDYQGAHVDSYRRCQEWRWLMLFWAFSSVQKSNQLRYTKFHDWLPTVYLATWLPRSWLAAYSRNSSYHACMPCGDYTCRTGRHGWWLLICSINIVQIELNVTLMRKSQQSRETWRGECCLPFPSVRPLAHSDALLRPTVLAIIVNRFDTAWVFKFAVTVTGRSVFNGHHRSWANRRRNESLFSWCERRVSIGWDNPPSDGRLSHVKLKVDGGRRNES